MLLASPGSGGGGCTLPVVPVQAWPGPRTLLSSLHKTHHLSTPHTITTLHHPPVLTTYQHTSHLDHSLQRIVCSNVSPPWWYRYQVCGMCGVKVWSSLKRANNNIHLYTIIRLTPVMWSPHHLGPVCCGNIVFEGDPATAWYWMWETVMSSESPGYSFLGTVYPAQVGGLLWAMLVLAFRHTTSRNIRFPARK